jgi:hypothetical protein
LFARLLFLITVLLAFGLAVLVVVSPWLDGDSVPAGWERFFAVFAEDALVRRTALASAAGLLVTAFVFFRRRRVPQDSEAAPSP